jgi:hypothetical protein
VRLEEPDACVLGKSLTRSPENPLQQVTDTLLL